ncbi:hypothetical protein ABPG72_010046 [Tetrahymena utriculariae]
MKKKSNLQQKEETKISEILPSSIKPAQIQSVKAGTSDLKQQKAEESVPTIQNQDKKSVAQNSADKNLNTEKKTITSKANPLSSKTTTAKTSNNITNSLKSTAKLNDKKDGKIAKKQIGGKIKGKNVFAMINKNIIQTILAF